ncbi:unnamed protein product [Paramecium octaurelia]|uniref:Uncharacterized protein n=1 Tax=Paramecium octaurelia TaxID=43137 RepID=A0A8S1X5G7_PAROT|nr:unnamed protein product [Paramecium octaurelia]
MGIMHTRCVEECRSKEQNTNSELQVIQNKQILKRNLQTTNEQCTQKTTQKGTIFLCDPDQSMEIKEEDSSSNLQNNPIPAFVSDKQLHQFVVPRRENRFISDIENEVKEKIKKIQYQEKFEALQMHYSKLNLQQCPQIFHKSSSNVPNQNELISNLNCFQSSSLVIEKLQSTQVDCISGPNKERRGILKSNSPQKQSKSFDTNSVNSNKRVHFSGDTKFKSEDAIQQFQWRKLRIE